MTKDHRTIIVKGPYIARQDIGMQILHAEHVHQAPDFNHRYANDCATSRVVEDVVCEEITSEATEKHANSYPFVVADNLAKLNLYSLPEFEKMYSDAAAGNASVFAEFLKKYQKLGVLDFTHLNKKQILKELKAFFSDKIKYTYRNFVVYF